MKEEALKQINKKVSTSEYEAALALALSSGNREVREAIERSSEKDQKNQ
jgi:hypothetical protein